MVDDSAEDTAHSDSIPRTILFLSLLTSASTPVLTSFFVQLFSSSVDHPPYKPWLEIEIHVLLNTVPLPVAPAVLELETGDPVEPGNLGP